MCTLIFWAHSLCSVHTLHDTLIHLLFSVQSQFSLCIHSSVHTVWSVQKCRSVHTLICAQSPSAVHTNSLWSMHTLIPQSPMLSRHLPPGAALLPSLVEDLWHRGQERNFSFTIRIFGREISGTISPHKLCPVKKKHDRILFIAQEGILEKTFSSFLCLQHTLSL